MGVNGVELKVGQVWKDREGREVTIVYWDDARKFEFRGSNDIKYTMGGNVWTDGVDGCDLIELVQDENGWRPWIATDDSVSPVGGNDRVDVILRNGQQFNYRLAHVVRWRDCGVGSVARWRPTAGIDQPEEGDDGADDPATHAVRILRAAECHMRDRAATYDTPEGERSMGKAVSAFNAIRDRDLTEAEGWLLIQLLKDVRLFSAPGYHADSAEDCIAYAALKAEAKAGEVA